MIRRPPRSTLFPSTTLSRSGLAEPHGSLTFFAQDDKSAGRTDSSRGEQGQILQIGGPATAGEKEKDQVYVRFSPRGFVYTLPRSEEHTSELQSQSNLVCRLL